MNRKRDKSRLSTKYAFHDIVRSVERNFDLALNDVVIFQLNLAKRSLFLSFFSKKFTIPRLSDRSGDC